MLAVLHTCHIKKKRFENFFLSMIYLNPHKKLTKHDVRSFPKKARSQKVKKKQKTLDEAGGKWKKRQRRRYIICCYWSNYLSYRKCSCRVGYCVNFTIWDTFWDLLSVFSFLFSCYGFVIRNDTPWYYQGSSNEDFARYDVLSALKPIRVNLWLSSSINYHLKTENEKFWAFKTW